MKAISLWQPWASLIAVGAKKIETRHWPEDAIIGLYKPIIATPASCENTTRGHGTARRRGHPMDSLTPCRPLPQELAELVETSQRVLSELAALRQSVASLGSDEFIALVLALGVYSVEVESGEISGPAGKILRPSVNRYGYHYVGLSYLGSHYKAMCHRIVAIAAFGIEAVAGHSIGHRDHVRANNRATNLWIPENARQHNERDGLFANLILGQQHHRTEWPPCVNCGAPDGPIHPSAKYRSPDGNNMPARVTGRRFGIEGDLCWPCYRMFHERERRRRIREEART